MRLPITKEDFEAIVETATGKMGIAYDDNMRVMSISFFHSLGREHTDFDLEKLESYLYTAVSHDMTYHIGQEIHKKRVAEAEAKKQQEEQAKIPLCIVEPV